MKKMLLLNLIISRVRHHQPNTASIPLNVLVTDIKIVNPDVTDDEIATIVGEIAVSGFVSEIDHYDETRQLLFLSNRV